MIKSFHLPQRLVQGSVLLAFLGSWHFVTAYGDINHLLLPAPWPVFRDFWVLLTAGAIWPDVLVTLREWITAFLFASVAGCSFGYIVSRSGYTVKVFDPLLAGLYSI